MYTIAEIETAILDRLRDQLPTVREFGTLGDFLKTDADSLSMRTPAVYVLYDRGSYEHLMSGVQDRSMTFTVVVVVENFRGDQAARHGMAGDLGAYELIDGIRAALTNHQCGLNIDPLLPVEEQAVEGTESVVVYGISFKTRCRTML